MSFRIQQINSLVAANISEILMKELSIKPGVFVSVTKVDTSKDLRYTHIFVSVFPFDQNAYVRSTLQKELFRIQGALNKKLHLLFDQFRSHGGVLQSNFDFGRLVRC